MITYISTVKDLNTFIMSVGTISPDKIISHLEAKKVIVSPIIAKLITDKAINQI